MNSTDTAGNLRVSVGRFVYAIFISIGIPLAIITTMGILASYFCRTLPTTPPQNLSARALRQPATTQEPLPDVELGLDEETLKTYPTLLYSKAKLKNKDSTATCCSICLADYKDTDTLRLLQDCGHLFHQKCVDAWLRMHPTCPICRSSPLPTPLPTPLAEVVPLAASRSA